MLIKVVLVLDILRFMIAAFGTLAGSLELHDTFIDQKEVRESGKNGPRLLIVRTSISNEALRLVVHLIFLEFAITSLAAPLPAVVWNLHPIPALVNRILQIVGTICLTVKSYTDRYVRARLREYWNDAQEPNNRRISDRKHQHYQQQQ